MLRNAEVVEYSVVKPERRARGRFYRCGSEKRAVLERTRSNRFSPWFYRRPCAGLSSLVHFLGFPRIASCAIVAYFAPEYSQLHATTDVIVVGMTLAPHSSLGPCRSTRDSERRYLTFPPKSSERSVLAFIVITFKNDNERVD